MGIGRATCTCKVCGATFERTSERGLNSLREQEWIDYAKENFTTCPACYYKKRAAERGLVAKVLYNAGIFDFYEAKEDMTIMFIFSGDTYSHKDELKEMGAIWDGDRSRWTLYSTEDELAAKYTELERIDCAINHGVDDVPHKKYDAAKAVWEDNQKAIDAELEAIGGLPAWPEDIKDLWHTGESWNGKFYGRSGNYSIYLSNRKVILTDDQKERMEATADARSSYRSSRRRIIKKYFPYDGAIR